MTRHTTTRHATTRHTTTCTACDSDVRVTWHAMMSRHATSQHVTTWHATTRHAMTQHTTARHAMTRHVMTRHAPTCTARNIMARNNTAHNHTVTAHNDTRRHTHAIREQYVRQCNEWMNDTTTYQYCTSQQHTNTVRAQIQTYSIPSAARPRPGSSPPRHHVLVSARALRARKLAQTLMSRNSVLGTLTLICPLSRGHTACPMGH